MSREEGDSRLRWAFGLAVLMHVGALAALPRLPLAHASKDPFDQLPVFGASASFSGSLVTLVEWPPPGSPPSGAATVATPEPGAGPKRPTRPQPAPPSPTRPARPVKQRPAGTDRPEVAPSPEPDPQPPAQAGPAEPGGQGSPPVDIGTPSPAGTVPAGSGPAGGGEATPGQTPGDGDGGAAQTPGGNDPDGGAASGPGGGDGPAPGTDHGGDGGGPPGSSAPGPPKVVWANPTVIEARQPEYPEAAVADAVEGTVVMKVLVGEQGEVVEAEVLRSSHDARLDRAALAAVRQWRYEPATQDGQAHAVYTRATIRFMLR